MNDYTFTLNLRVFDPAQLFKAALARAIEEGAGTSVLFSDDHGTVDLEACLVMLLDPGHLPGCSIHQSMAESERS